MPTTLRIALLAGLLALLSNLVVIGFIYLRTHDESVSTIRRQVTEQAKLLSDVYRDGGKAELDDAIQDSITYADGQTAIGLFDGQGRPLIGNFAVIPVNGRPLRDGYRDALIRLTGQNAAHQGAITVQRLPNGQWLVAGHIFGEGLALRKTLENSLVIGLGVASLLGLICGLVLAKYVGRRVARITAVADRISGRDLSQRVPLTGADDAFDRLGAQINAMLDRISALMDELRLLTDSLAHDLRSPVSRLRSAAHAAVLATDPAEQEEQLASVTRQADSLMRILTAVLEISRSEAMTGRKQFTWFDTGELTAELSEMYEPVVEERGIVLAFTPRDQPLPLFGHRQLLAQAISNLIENALRYGASGGEIRIDAARSGDRLRIAVADRGPGIPEHLRAEALRRFGRLDSSRSAEGAGLGLALAQAIAHLHDGKLLMEDNNPGLRIVLDLPLGAEGASA